MQNGKPQHQSDPNNLIPQLCMTFSAVIKSLQGSLNTENVIPTCEKVWEWVKATIGEAALSIPKEPTATNDRESTKDQHETANGPIPGKPEVMEGQGRITEKQHKRLFAIAKEAGMTNQQLKARLKQHYGIDSTQNIPWKQYDEICTAVEENTWPF